LLKVVKGLYGLLEVSNSGRTWTRYHSDKRFLQCFLSNLLPRVLIYHAKSIYYHLPT